MLPGCLEHSVMFPTQIEPIDAQGSCPHVTLWKVSPHRGPLTQIIACGRVVGAGMSTPQTWTCWSSKPGQPPRPTPTGRPTPLLPPHRPSLSLLSAFEQRSSKAALALLRPPLIGRVRPGALCLLRRQRAPPPLAPDLLQGRAVCAGGIWRGAALCSNCYVRGSRDGCPEPAHHGCRGGGAAKRGRQAAAVLH